MSDSYPDVQPAFDPQEGRRWAEWLGSLSDEDASMRDEGEPTSDGGTVLMDLVAAVDYLRRGLRPSFTVWDAFEEALRWHNDERQSHAHGAADPDLDDLDARDPDPLRSQVRRLTESVDEGGNDTQMDATLQQALRRWLTTMSQLYNAGYTWPPPKPRRDLPPRWA